MMASIIKNRYIWVVISVEDSPGELYEFANETIDYH